MAANETENVEEVRKKQERGEQLTPREQQILDDENRRNDNDQATQGQKTTSEK